MQIGELKLDVPFRLSAEFTPLYLITTLISIGMIPSFASPGVEIEESFPSSERSYRRTIFVGFIAITLSVTLIISGVLASTQIAVILSAVRNCLAGLGFLLVV
ncbi:MAG: hypothetical protein SPG61_03275, partial [Arcanobacterium sp.]|nr:hypothetical protein [Arcanobacterium sp.]